MEESVTETSIKTPDYKITLKSKALTPWSELLKGFVGQLKAQGYIIEGKDLEKLESFWEERI